MINAINKYEKLNTKDDQHDYFEACVQLMDDDLRERTIEIASHQQTDNDERNFLDIYSKLHLEKFNEEFIVN